MIIYLRVHQRHKRPAQQTDHPLSPAGWPRWWPTSLQWLQTDDRLTGDPPHRFILSIGTAPNCWREFLIILLRFFYLQIFENEWIILPYFRRLRRAQKIFCLLNQTTNNNFKPQIIISVSGMKEQHPKWY